MFAVELSEKGESTNFHVRYFEVAPGGWTTLEHHQHEHVVVIVRGSGYIQLGSEAYAMHVGDVGYTAPEMSINFDAPRKRRIILGLFASCRQRETGQ